jgi:hypothetical protein
MQRFSVRNISDRSAIPGATVKVCALTDLECATPSFQAQSAAADGHVDLELPMTPGVGFEGFLDVSGGGVHGTMYFPRPPVAEATPDARNILVFTDSLFNLFVGLAGATADPTRGNIALVATDCSLNGAAGVRLTASTADAMSTQNYTVNGFPSSTATTTDASGAGGFINLPVGPVVMTAERASPAAFIGSLTFPIRANTITSSQLPPTP